MKVKGVLLYCAVFFGLLSCGDPVGVAGPPTPSSLSVQAAGSGTWSVALSWTACPDDLFSKYKLYRSVSPGIQNNPSDATLLQTFTSASQTSYVDSVVSSGTVYFYALQTENSMELFSWSNEESMETPDQPAASILSVQPAGSGTWNVALSWTACPDDLFSKYELYRSVSPGIQNNPSDATLVKTFTSSSQTYYVDSAVSMRSGYFYALKTENSAGLFSWSNEVSIETPDVAQFVVIPSGSYVMGSPSNEEGRLSNESPQHTVHIQSFQLMSTEVTQGMWQNIMGENPSYFQGDLNRPVEKVSWNDCQAFISQLNSMDTDYSYRLPSESEWEYAARAGTTTRFYWGADPGDSPALIGQYAWWGGNSGGTTHPVGQKLPNAWGLYDMSGNVWEWVEDWYHSSYSGAPDDGSPWIDPPGSDRVSRGGSWYSNARYCRSARRGYSPVDRDYNLGFRLARSAR